MSRRRLFAVSMLLATMAGAAAAAESVDGALSRYAFSEPHMGTQARIVVYMQGETQARRAQQELTLAALDMALKRRRPLPGLMHHSDRGSQYAAGAYQKRLTEHGIVCSMSRKGNCWDNAPMESFFHTLKTELVHHRDYQTRDEARHDIFEFVEVFYNHQRSHSTLGYLSPVQFEVTALAA